MKPGKRALRRHHRQRMLRCALRSLVLSWLRDDERRHAALRRYDNLARCSCWMCGNPRRYEGRVTLQEQRLMEAARTEVDESVMAVSQTGFRIPGRRHSSGPRPKV